jgi:hypothetical protein
MRGCGGGGRRFGGCVVSMSFLSKKNEWETYHLLSALVPSGTDSSMPVSFGLRNDCSISLR